MQPYQAAQPGNARNPAQPYQDYAQPYTLLAGRELPTHLVLPGACINIREGPGAGSRLRGDG